MIDRFLRGVPALVWMALIFALSSREQFPSPPGFSLFSLTIVAHLALYGVLALLLLLTVERDRRSTRSAQIAVIAIAVLYGVSDEFHQSFVPGRDASLFDIVIDALGATIAIVLWTSRQTIRSVIALR